MSESRTVIRRGPSEARNSRAIGPPRSEARARLLLYLIVFFGSWTAWVLFVYPRMQSLGDRSFAYAAANIGTRLLVWVAPVLLVVRYIDMRNPLEYLGLVERWRRGVLVGLLVSLMNFIGSWARFGPPDPAMSSVTWNSILSTSCASGFIEEVPFRGFVLQKLEELIPPVLANALSSLLFTAIHLPGWLLLGTFRIDDALTIFAIGVTLGAVFKFSGSLWSAVIAHSSNNLFLAIFFT